MLVFEDMHLSGKAVHRSYQAGNLIWGFTQRKAVFSNADGQPVCAGLAESWRVGRPPEGLVRVIWTVSGFPFTRRL